MNDSVDVVPAGYASLADSDSYYPGDMPVEWRLTYFSNAFPALLVPASQWLTNPDLLGDWREDVHPGFRFYLEAPEASDDPRLTSAVKALGDRLTAIVAASVPDGGARPGYSRCALLCPGTGRQIGWSERCPTPLIGDLRGARAWLGKLAVRPSLIVLERPTSGQLQQWRDLLVLLGWA